MNLNKAIEIAARAHAGQLDKSGQPYILHPLRVMLNLKDPNARIVAVLHDVIEDTSVTMSQIKSLGFKKEIIAALALMTHDKTKYSYPDYVRRIRDSKNEVAIQVKLADLKDNTDPVRLRSLDAKTRRRMNKRHSEALRILKGADRP